MFRLSAQSLAQAGNPFFKSENNEFLFRLSNGLIAIIPLSESTLLEDITSQRVSVEVKSAQVPQEEKELLSAQELTEQLKGTFSEADAERFSKGLLTASFISQTIVPGALNAAIIQSIQDQGNQIIDLTVKAENPRTRITMERSQKNGSLSCSSANITQNIFINLKVGSESKTIEIPHGGCRVILRAAPLSKKHYQEALRTKRDKLPADSPEKIKIEEMLTKIPPPFVFYIERIDVNNPAIYHLLQHGQPKASPAYKAVLKSIGWGFLNVLSMAVTFVATVAAFSACVPFMGPFAIFPAAFTFWMGASAVAHTARQAKHNWSAYKLGKDTYKAAREMHAQVRTELSKLSKLSKLSNIQEDWTIVENPRSPQASLSSTGNVEVILRQHGPNSIGDGNAEVDEGQRFDATVQPDQIVGADAESNVRLRSDSATDIIMATPPMISSDSSDSLDFGPATSSSACGRTKLRHSFSSSSSLNFAPSGSSESLGSSPATSSTPDSDHTPSSGASSSSPGSGSLTVNGILTRPRSFSS